MTFTAMMTLGNMRENGVRTLAVTCGALWCHHEAVLDVSTFTMESGHVRCTRSCPLWAKSGHGSISQMAGMEKAAPPFEVSSAAVIMRYLP